MKCNEIIFETISFCCAELDGQKEKEFKRHITLCKNCAGYYFRIRKTLQYLNENIPEIKQVELMYEIQIDRQG
ncbi:MAG: hypothetical protein FWH43_02720 [Endomicrobia bacterium]|nr:hypothetical protein [Endomicrobiia bacterium]